MTEEGLYKIPNLVVQDLNFLIRKQLLGLREPSSIQGIT